MSKHILENMVGGSRQTDMNLISQEYSQNLVLEPVGEGAGPSSRILRSIPGLTTFLEVPGTPRGRFVASKGLNGQPRLFVCYDTSVYVIDYIEREWRATFVGNVASSMEPVSMCETGGSEVASPMLVVADGTSIHVVPTDTPAADIEKGWRNIKLPKKADLKTDIRPSHVTYQSNYLTCNDTTTDNMYFSFAYPFETMKNGKINYDVFTTSDFGKDEYPTGRAIPADWCTDPVTAMVSTGGVLYAIGPRSFQRFMKTDNSTQPFNSPNTSAMNIGILAKDSLATIGEDIFFLGSSDVGQFGIYRANGHECVRVSLPEMERVISQFKNPADAIGFCWTSNTHVYYAITFQEDDVTYVYDVYTKVWHNRVSTTPEDNRDHAWRYRYAFLYNNRIMFLTHDAIVVEDPDKWTEHDGRPIIRLRRGGATINGCTPFFVDNVVFLLSNGYGNLLDPNVRPKVMLRYSLNGTTMSNERMGYMGRQGDYNFMTVFPRLGRGCVLNMELSCSENIDFTILKCAINHTGNMRGF